jgi:hypothetical protein
MLHFRHQLPSAWNRMLLRIEGTTILWTVPQMSSSNGEFASSLQSWELHPLGLTERARSIHLLCMYVCARLDGPGAMVQPTC